MTANFAAMQKKKEEGDQPKDNEKPKVNPLAALLALS
jgi:hypothetical protein